MGIVRRFPRKWRTDVMVLRGGGRDLKGNPLPVTEIPVQDCIVAPRATSEPTDRADLISSTAVLYRDPDPVFKFLPKDRVRVPVTARMAGEWAVDGLPGEWPLGDEVALVRS
jgi:hypothetical protein